MRLNKKNNPRIEGLQRCDGPDHWNDDDKLREPSKDFGPKQHQRLLRSDAGEETKPGNSLINGSTFNDVIACYNILYPLFY